MGSVQTRGGRGGRDSWARELTQGAKLYLRSPLGCSIHSMLPGLLSLPEPSPHPVLACPCPGAPRSHLRALPLSQPTFPGEHSPLFLHCSTVGHTLGQPELCGHLQHPLPPPGAARQGEWKMVGADNVCITHTMMMAWLNSSVCTHPG